MNQQNSIHNRGRRQSLLSAVYGFCFLFVFSTSLLGQFSLGILLSRDLQTSASHCSKVVSQQHDAPGTIPSDLPWGTEPDNEEGAKVETERELDHEVLIWNHFVVAHLITGIEKSSWSNFVSRIENREPVSLIILHHSWKSFLC